MGIFCALAVGAGRLDRTPSKLEVFGLDLCDGEPCFRGVKAGTDWVIVKKAFPQGVEKETYDLGAPSDMLDLQQIEFFPSDNHKIAESIQVTTKAANPIPVSAGDVLMQYGPPCYVELGDIPGSMTIIYPKMTVQLNMIASDDHHLQLNSAISGLEIHNYLRQCHEKTSANSGPWHGFISMEEYRQRNLNEVGIVQSNVGIP